MDQQIEEHPDGVRLARFDLLLASGLNVTGIGPDRFETQPGAAIFDRIYGGQVLAQSLLAAIATVEPGRRLHSLHAYFLRLGNPADPVRFDVDRVSDTRSFSTRLVRAAQRDQPVATVLMSFHRPTEGFLAHQDSMPTVPAPEDLPSRDARMLEHYGNNLPLNAGLAWPVEIRYVDREPWETTKSNGRNQMWIRLPRSVGADPLLNAALLLFASDLTMFEPVIARHDLSWEDLIDASSMFGATLDHSFWLHIDVVFDDWLLHVHESTVAANGRGFTTGRFFTRAGDLVASVAQEIVIKRVHQVTKPAMGRS